MAQAQALAHHLAPQIKIAVFEPQLLVNSFIKLKGQRFAAIENLDFFGEDLDRS